MNKKVLVFTSISAVIIVSVASLVFVLVKKPKQTNEVFFATPTITRDYTTHYKVKTFPAPYKEVGALPLPK